jgi:transcriptional regulator with XRE-family HTH domain
MPARREPWRQNLRSRRTGSGSPRSPRTMTAVRTRPIPRPDPPRRRTVRRVKGCSSLGGERLRRNAVRRLGPYPRSPPFHDQALPRRGAPGAGPSCPLRRRWDGGGRRGRSGDPAPRPPAGRDRRRRRAGGPPQRRRRRTGSRRRRTRAGPQVQKYEDGTNRIAASTLARIAAHFGVPIETFFPRTPEAAEPMTDPAAARDIRDLSEAVEAMEPRHRVLILALARELATR